MEVPGGGLPAAVVSTALPGGGGGVAQPSAGVASTAVQSSIQQQEGGSFRPAHEKLKRSVRDLMTEVASIAEASKNNTDGVPPSSNIDGKLAEFSAVCDEMHLLLDYSRQQLLQRIAKNQNTSSTNS